MLRRFLTVLLALATLSQAAFAEDIAQNPGFELRAGALFDYASMHHDHDTFDHNYGLTDLGGFLSVGYRFQSFGLYLDGALTHRERQKPGENDHFFYFEDELEGMAFDLMLTGRFFLPINSDFAFVPNVGFGPSFDNVGGDKSFDFVYLQAQAGAGIDFKITDSILMMGEIDYLFRADFIFEEIGHALQAKLGLAYHF